MNPKMEILLSSFRNSNGLFYLLLKPWMESKLIHRASKIQYIFTIKTLPVMLCWIPHKTPPRLILTVTLWGALLTSFNRSAIWNQEHSLNLPQLTELPRSKPKTGLQVLHFLLHSAQQLYKCFFFIINALICQNWTPDTRSYSLKQPSCLILTALTFSSRSTDK